MSANERDLNGHLDAWDRDRIRIALRHAVFMLKLARNASDCEFSRWVEYFLESIEAEIGHGCLQEVMRLFSEDRERTTNETKV